MRWPLTFYVKSLPPTVGGCAQGPVIRILEKYRNDRGIYQHELLHVGQWAVWGVLSLAVMAILYQTGRLDLWGLALPPLAVHFWLYRFWPAYTLWAEVQCYRRQALHYTDDRRPLFAEFIATNYGLKVSRERALQLLRR